MHVILHADVKGLGRRGDTVEVAKARGADLVADGTAGTIEPADDPQATAARLDAERRQRAEADQASQDRNMAASQADADAEDRPARRRAPRKRA